MTSPIIPLLPNVDVGGPKLVILGSTGSIGTQALDIIATLRHTMAKETVGNFSIEGLAAGGAHYELLAEQVLTWSVPRIALACPSARQPFLDALRSFAERHHLPVPSVDILTGEDAARDLILSANLHEGDVVLNAMTGAVGLVPTLTALATGARLALANKESLVVGGAVVRQAMVRPGQIVPVDSEHSAIFQCLAAGLHERGMCARRFQGPSTVRRLILTASGGPFRGKHRDELRNVTAAQALAHPTWSMGPVVTVNSSTLMNKGLELIEAHLLFDVPASEIDVVVHPQSMIHSMVEFVDGATMAQVSPPDMRLPIALGLCWPRRPILTTPLSGQVDTVSSAYMGNSSPYAGLEASAYDTKTTLTPTNFAGASSWTFEPVDCETFIALDLAREAVSSSPTHPAVLNAANEQAVDAFLNGTLAWLDICRINEQVLHDHHDSSNNPVSVEDVMAAQEWARHRANELIARRASEGRI
ncbi:1-deoxy-D-xylulose-5-phosphate reductoisomerase [Actinomyces vulturis]|uniref:1-deoxy-D-xylulose-5-phosphate reductoisomerase n=1 Tax=Actinomyces vulturis TaxID=1857645 RepID=UPI00082A6187|nr:1-deoxy-D-xylulose-5-phosphate reductoisomerase [Actinomyces vulturis]